MAAPTPLSTPRRAVVAGGLASLAAAVVGARPASARWLLQRGMSGGGLAQLEGATPLLANFGLFASAMQLSDGSTLVLGVIQWIEAGTDLRLESIEVTSCVPMEERPDGAEVRGRMAVNGEGDYPFVVRAIDAGRPGSGLDRIEIGVNTAEARAGAEPAEGDDGFVYEAAATLVAGNLQWIVADVELSG